MEAHSENDAGPIRLPEPVSHELRRMIRKAYDSAVLEIDEEDEEYVARKIHRVASRLLSQDATWLVQLGRTALAVNATRGDSKDCPTASAGLKKHIVASLFYLCEPFDLIPDHTPGRGYLDDALVMQACVAKIRNQNPPLYTWILENIAQSAEGIQQQDLAADNT